MNVSENLSCFDGPEFTRFNSFCEAVLWSRRIVSVVSMFSSFLVIVLVILFKKFRVFNQRLILYLSISAFIQPFAYLVSDYRIAENNGFCVFTAFLTQVMDWVLVLWVCCITLTVFLAVVFSKSAKKLEIPYHIVCWGVPVVLGVIPFIPGAYGRAGLWCWIMSTRDGMEYTTGIVLQFVFYYVPLITISLGIIIVSVAMIIVLRRRSTKYEGSYNPKQDEKKEILRKQVRSLYFYPWVFAILFIIPFINRIRLAAGHSVRNSNIPVELSFILWYLHALTLPFLGTVNAVIFTLDKSTRSRLTWTNIKNALLRRNTSKVAKPYDIDVSVEQSANVVGTVHGSNLEAAPDGDVEKDGPGGDVEKDGPGGGVEEDGPCGDIEEDGPGGDVEEAAPDRDVEEDGHGGDMEKNGPGRDVEEDGPGGDVEEDAPGGDVEEAAPSSDVEAST